MGIVIDEKVSADRRALSRGKLAGQLEGLLGR